MTARRSAVLALYKRVLKGAAKFPSKNRWKVYEEIRVEFREKAALDPESAKAAECVKVAEDSLAHLEPYNNLDPDAKDWVVHTVEQPMPPPPGWKKDINEFQKPRDFSKIDDKKPRW